MNLCALMLARNEDWIIGYSLRAALLTADSAVVMLHACTDATESMVVRIAHEYPGRVTICHWHEAENWREMDMRQETLEAARRIGATHILINDADEVLSWNYSKKIRSWLNGLIPGQCVNVPMIPMWRSPTRYRVDSCIWTRAWMTIAFTDHPNLHWKPRDGNYQLHSRPPHANGGKYQFGRHGEGGMMHYQFSDWSRLTAKHAWYKMTERVHYPTISLAEIEQRYNQALDEEHLRTAPAPPEWFSDAYHTLSANHLQYDYNQPWQVEDCQRMLKEHGPSHFLGLDLFGVV